MYRHLALILLLSGLSGTLLSAPMPDIRVRAEYRHDAVDYEEETRDFYRIKTSLMLSRGSSLNFTGVYLNHTGEHRHTWNLLLGDIAPWISLLLGHFQVNYGTGLLLGKFAAYNPDPFTYRSPGIVNKTYIPVSSGNPAYAFHGAALTSSCDAASIHFSLSGFYSLNRRYINEDGYFSGTASTTIGTVESSLHRDYYHSEPVTIHTTGMMAAAGLDNSISIQLYGTGTRLHSLTGTPLSWDGNGNDPLAGTEHACGAGATAQYADRFLSLFVEGVATMMKRTSTQSSDARRQGSGYLYGFRLRHPSVSLSMIRKVTTPGYYAPYNSTVGERTPEKAVFMEGSYHFLSDLTIGASLAMEKKQVPSSSDDEPPFLLREQLHIEYSRGRIESARITAKRYRKGSRGDMDENRQVRQSVSIRLTEKTWRLDGAAVYGWDAADRSAIGASIGVSCIPGNTALLMVQYTRAIIYNDGSLYSVLAPMDNARIPGMFIRHDSHIIAGKVRIRWKSLCFNTRYLHQFVGGKTFRSTVEFSASSVF